MISYLSGRTMPIINNKYQILNNSHEKCDTKSLKYLTSGGTIIWGMCKDGIRILFVIGDRTEYEVQKPNLKTFR